MGRTRKDASTQGGGYPTIEDFCAVYGLNLLFGFWMPFCLTDDEKEDRQKTQIHTYRCLSSVLVHLSVCLFFVLYNVRAYVYVRLNVYKYKIMLISVNSFGYVEIVSYLCNVIKNKHY